MFTQQIIFFWKIEKTRLLSQKATDVSNCWLQEILSALKCRSNAMGHKLWDCHHSGWSVAKKATSRRRQRLATPSWEEGRDLFWGEAKSKRKFLTWLKFDTSWIWKFRLFEHFSDFHHFNLRQVLSNHFKNESVCVSKPSFGSWTYFYSGKERVYIQASVGFLRS